MSGFISRLQEGNKVFLQGRTRTIVGYVARIGKAQITIKPVEGDWSVRFSKNTGFIVGDSYWSLREYSEENISQLAIENIEKAERVELVRLMSLAKGVDTYHGNISDVRRLAIALQGVFGGDLVITQE